MKGKERTLSFGHCSLIQVSALGLLPGFVCISCVACCSYVKVSALAMLPGFERVVEQDYIKTSACATQELRVREVLSAGSIGLFATYLIHRTFGV